MPLSLLRKLTALRYTSALALMGVLYLLFLVCYFYTDREAIHPDPGKDRAAKWFNFEPQAVSSFSVFVFAFTCHQNLFPVYNEARNNSRTRMMIVIAACIGISTLLYLVMGNLG
jgi:amino acid permease